MKSYDLALDEIRQMNLKKQELSAVVSKLDREIREKSQIIGEIVAEIESLSNQVKTLKASEADVRKSNNEIKRINEEEKERLSKVYDEITRAGIANSKKSQELKKLSEELSEKMVEIKSREIKVNQKIDRVQSDEESLTSKENDLNNKEILLIKNQSRFFEDKKSFQNFILIEKEKLTAERDGIAKDIEIVKIRRNELERMTAHYKELSEDASKSKHAAEQKYNEYKSAVEEIDMMKLGIAKEKQEIDIQKKKVEIERLRVEKLAHDKGVEDELQKLRAERAVK